MYCPENVSLFGTHVAVTDHRCCGSIGVVTYAAVGTLAEILGSSPTVIVNPCKIANFCRIRM